MGYEERANGREVGSFFLSTPQLKMNSGPSTSEPLLAMNRLRLRILKRQPRKEAECDIKDVENQNLGFEASESYLLYSFGRCFYVK